MHSQDEMKQMVLPLLKTKGKIHQKIKKVFARKAKDIERITTTTSDGRETINQAKPGDYIVKNQTDAEEEYVLTPQKFRARYNLKNVQKLVFQNTNRKDEFMLWK